MRSAIIYTFVEQNHRHCHDPFAYFEWAVEQLIALDHARNTLADDAASEERLPNAWVVDQRTLPKSTTVAEASAPEMPDVWHLHQRCSVDRLLLNDY